jgi:ppGpp synthetase/RelA/SpoT-type nucleotidyltranferase
MAKEIHEYGLDLHCSMILQEYRENLPMYNRLRQIVLKQLEGCLKRSHLVVSGLEARVKQEASLAGKLELKGQKYKTIADITDIVGARIITFYNDEVDKISALVDSLFEVDWDNSVDKRKLLAIDAVLKGRSA